MSETATDYKTLYRSMTTPRLIQEAWQSTVDPKLRTMIVGELTARERKGVGTADGVAAWPSDAMETREREAGLYPDPADPQFAARLFAKREFWEARAVSSGVAEGTIDPCTSTAAERVFELTPVQRIVSRFMHPLTPYRGLLLFHGVGVGKTCSAVTIAEQFLEAAPQKRVIVLVPQALKENFKKTVFNAGALSWSNEAGEWKTRQCTGTSYLERLGLMNQQDERVIAYKTAEDIRSRYTVTGYQAFANWIQRTMDKSLPVGLTDKAVRTAAENEILRKLFSDHLIIIDEAHNLRDLAAEDKGEIAGEEAPGEDVGGAAEAAENRAGKALNPWLRRIVLNTEGLRLVLMSATPMYNAAPEICLLLTYLLLNDSKSESDELRVNELFDKNGVVLPSAAYRIEAAARRYVSYMRGENPFTFPLRMKPVDAPAEPGTMWPSVSATKREVDLTPEDVAALNALPLYFTTPVEGSPVERLLRAATARAPAAAVAAEAVAESEAEAESESEAEAATKPKTDVMLDLRMQMANISYPNEMYGSAGWDNYFKETKIAAGAAGGNRIRVMSPRPQSTGPFEIDSVFRGEGLRAHAPKIYKVVESIKSAKGICFAYSRYIKAGALPLAIALERAGFQRRLADGRIAPLLTGVSTVAPICALCGESADAVHDTHPFRPACYVLLTSDDELSPRFAGLVSLAANWPDDPEWGPEGGMVKAIIGSQVASEGLDLKCVREMHVLDAWYHLNRTDQIIGRGIRYCSHSALRAAEKRQGLAPLALQNCLIYLHALRPLDYESADMYAYRIAIRKAQAVGKVQRLLKRHAWDCNLELEAITFVGLPPRQQKDGQGIMRNSPETDGWSPNDVDYTSYCDYAVCEAQCALNPPRTPEEGLELDESTFGVADARRIILAKQDIVRGLFQSSVMVPETLVKEIFSDLPWEIASEALIELIDGRKFKLTRPDGVSGFLIKKAGYLVFQPEAMGSQTQIPMALRYGRAWQLRRRFAEVVDPVMGRMGEAAAVMPSAASAASVPSVPAAAAAASGAPVVAGAAGAAAAGAAAAPVFEKTGAIKRWEEWDKYVSTGAAPPDTLSPSLHKMWPWIFKHFAPIPQTKDVARRWWFDHLPTPEQRTLLEEAAATDTDSSIAKTLASDIFRTSRIVGYRIYNPETMLTEYMCRRADDVSGPFTSCSSGIVSVIEKELNKQLPSVKTDMGPLFGFMAAKEGRLVFKTLDTTVPIKPSSIGAECGNTSNLSVHQPRVRILQAAARESELAPLMLPDEESTWDATAAKVHQKAGIPEHLKDITHQPLCLYMEFLCRLLEERSIGGRRWFLTAPAAAAAGLKGKAVKR